MIHVKNQREIDKMRAACRLAAELLAEMSERVQPGVSTGELNDFAADWARKRGAKSAPFQYRGADGGNVPFPGSICTSLNNVVCHGIPDARTVLKDGDILNIDVTLIVDGFHGDTSRMFFVGSVDDEAKRLVEETAKAMYAGIGAIQPGGRISDIGEAIEDFLAPHGYGIVRELTGHGIGRKFHEAPTVPHYRQRVHRDRLRPGMTFTVEPMVNQGGPEVDFDTEDGWTVWTQDASLSAQFEHTCLVTEDGFEILTRL